MNRRSARSPSPRIVASASPLSAAPRPRRTRSASSAGPSSRPASSSRTTCASRPRTSRSSRARPSARQQGQRAGAAHDLVRQEGVPAQELRVRRDRPAARRPPGRPGERGGAARRHQGRQRRRRRRPGAPLEVDSLGDDKQAGDSEVHRPGEKTITFKVTAEKGTKLSYFCAVHPWMQGKIKVK